MSNDKLRYKIASYIVDYPRFEESANEVADLIMLLVVKDRDDMKAKCLKAIEKAPFDLSSTEFPYKREHQEEGLNIAIKAIKDIK